MQRAGMKSGAMAWAKASSLCDLCGPAGCDHTHAPTGLEQSLEQMEFTRSACNAAHVGEVARLTRMIERNSGCVHHDGTSDRTGYTPLHYAARGGHVECVALLLRSGASVLARTSAGGATPLHRAAFAGRTEVCTMLVRAGAQVDAQDADGETALHKAASQGHAQVLAALETVRRAHFAPARLHAEPPAPLRLRTGMPRSCSAGQPPGQAGGRAREAQRRVTAAKRERVVMRIACDSRRSHTGPYSQATCARAAWACELPGQHLEQSLRVNRYT